jgi:hypothetical protein
MHHVSVCILHDYESNICECCLYSGLCPQAMCYGPINTLLYPGDCTHTIVGVIHIPVGVIMEGVIVGLLLMDVC